MSRDAVSSLSTFLLLTIPKSISSTSSKYVCDSPYINNGRPVNVPEETYAAYCCEAKKYSSGYSSSRFSCETRGGCCGETDSQYCCDVDKTGVQLGLGITAGTLVLLGLIALLLYCVVTRSFGQEIHCVSCCKCEVRNKERSYFYNGYSLNTQPSENIRSPNDTYTSHHASRPSRPYPEPDCFVTTVAPSAPSPPTPTPERDLSDAPPSYDDVVNNPSGFPKTSRSDPQVYV